MNLYNPKAFLYQDPYPTACTAASTMIMLNTIAYRRTGGPGFRWTPYRVKNNTANRADVRDMTSILWFERGRDTLAVGGAGSDAHGWRNALNYYGWGTRALDDVAASVYEDLAFGSYDLAVHAAVRAIAWFGMPVGILAWAGGHALTMTGYEVSGANPAVSDAFTVRYVYLSDPLWSDHLVNARVSNATFMGGSLRVRFRWYRQTDSPYDDPHKPGWRRSSVSPTVGQSEWYRRWVIVAPVRGWLPPVDPPPDPNPSPTPTPLPTPLPTPTPLPSAAPDASPLEASASPSAEPVASVAPSSQP